MWNLREGGKERGRKGEERVSERELLLPVNENKANKTRSQ